MGKRLSQNDNGQKKKVKFAEEEEENDVDYLELDTVDIKRKSKIRGNYESSDESDGGNTYESLNSGSWSRNREDEEEIEAGSLENEKIEPFNMRQEEEEGYFDKEGNYVRNVDLDLAKDNWLSGVSENEIAKARKAKEKYTEKKKQVESETKLSEEELKSRIKDFLKPNENMYGAIRRLGKESKPKLLELTEYCNMMVSKGKIGIYEETYESLSKSSAK